MRKRFIEKRKNLSELENLELEIKDRLEGGKVKELARKVKKGDKNKQKFKFKFWDKKKLDKQPTRSFIITMLFSNGTLKTWVISTKTTEFTIKGKNYQLYYEECYFDISLNQYHLFYHQDFTVPINREIVKEGNEAFWSVTPENMKGFVAMKYITALTKISDNKYFLIMMVMGVVIVVLLGYIMMKMGGA